MNSPVIHVPGLAKVPAEATSPVYIFANGVQPQRRGPLGFQGDVFPTAPGDADYSPLRSLVLVSWKDTATARELTSATEVLDAQKAGERGARAARRSHQHAVPAVAQRAPVGAATTTSSPPEPDWSCPICSASATSRPSSAPVLVGAATGVLHQRLLPTGRAAALAALTQVIADRRPRRWPWTGGAAVRPLLGA